MLTVTSDCMRQQRQQPTRQQGQLCLYSAGEETVHCATVPGADSEEGSVAGASSLYHAALATVRQLSNGLK